MAGRLFNLAKMNTATTGTGTITLSTAASGFLTFAQAGVTNGLSVTYIIEDGANRELGQGTYTSSGTTLTRSVIKSTNSDAAINLSGSATVGITAAAENFLEWYANFDANGFNIGFDDNTGINDDSNNETIRFRKTSSAVNYLEVLNTETGAGPRIAAAGDDTNIDLRLEAKGTGRVQIPNATLTAPALGTPASGTLTNCTGLPIAGVTGLDTSTTAGRLARYSNSTGSQAETTGLFEDGSGNVGAGTTAPTSRLTVSNNTSALPTPPSGTALHVGQADGTISRILLDAFAQSTAVSFRRANGTAASPTALLSEQEIGSFASFGYGATGYSSGSRATMTTVTSENWTDTAQGAYLTLSTTPNGSTTRTERVRVTDAGLTGFLTTAPTEAVDVNSDAIRIRTSQTPASASATGDAGMICWDSNFIYVCVATNTWKRVAIATW